MDNIVQIQNIDVNALVSLLKNVIINEIADNQVNNSIVVHQDDTFLTKEEVTKYLKISLATLNRWVKDGYIPAYKPDRIVLFKKTEIDEFIKNAEHYPIKTSKIKFQMEKLRKTNIK